MASISKNSSEMYAYRSLKDALYERRLAPGTALIERSISEQLAVGRTPVRAALRRLSDEGFVDIIPNRGAFVMSTTKEQFAYYYDARIELHLLAARRGIEHYQKEDFSELRRVIEEEKKTAEQLKFRDYLDCVGEFYSIIMSKGNNPVLEDLYWILFRKMRIMLVLYDDFYMPVRNKLDSVKAHTGIVDALEEKDLEKFEIILRTHSQTVINNLRFENIATANVALAFRKQMIEGDN